jgi:hypothetical protein
MIFAYDKIANVYSRVDQIINPTRELVCISCFETVILINGNFVHQNLNNKCKIDDLRRKENKLFIYNSLINGESILLKLKCKTCKLIFLTYQLYLGKNKKCIMNCPIKNSLSYQIPSNGEQKGINNYLLAEYNDVFDIVIYDNDKIFYAINIDKPIPSWFSRGSSIHSSELNIFSYDFLVSYIIECGNCQEKSL